MANRTNNQNNNEEEKGSMTVREAGEKGGERTAETHGREFYEEIGHKGGQRVRELIEEGKEAEGGKQSGTDH
jgi:general stress protein YciG